MTIPRQRVTLRSLAAALDVHVSTVSRVLNGTQTEARSAASPEMIQRIRELAQSLNYRPNPQATGLRTRKTRTIGVLLPRLSDLVVATIYEGIDEAAMNHRYFTFVSSTLDDPQRQMQLGETALARNVEGLIVGDARTDTQTFINELAARDIPLVLVSRRAPGHCSVTCDDPKGGWIAAEHLLGQGHRDIAVLAGEPFASTGVDRTAGFLACCAAHGISIPAQWIVHSHFDTQSGRRAGDTLLASSRKPTAIFAVNDFLAIGLMGALRDHGMRAGKDVAVIGFNDTPLAAELPISLSSVRSPMREMGYRSLELLLQKLDGAQPEPELLEPTLIVRASSQLRT
ncbi:LacI family DNA-binding transcriptional regulator [Castellaniella sp.]|uniref:LacI family DNA-binding transcriptional regulator n=1 Tax=Castellaniella sp. TaxID=1955812 RepID=UPI003C786FB4